MISVVQIVNYNDEVEFYSIFSGLWIYIPSINKE